MHADQCLTSHAFFLWAGPPLVLRPMSIAVGIWGYTLHTATTAAHRQKRAAAAATTSSAPRNSNLSSNWDRYDAEGEAEDPTAAGKWSGQVAQQGRGLWVPSRAESGREQWKEEESTSTVRFGSCGPDC